MDFVAQQIDLSKKADYISCVVCIVSYLSKAGSKICPVLKGDR